MSDAIVIQLGVVDGQAEPDAQLVDALKHMLREAESGELQSLIAVGHTRCKEPVRCVAGSFNIFEIVGLLELVKFDLLADFDG